MSRRADRERPPALPLVTDAQAHKALDDLMPVIEELTNADIVLYDVGYGPYQETIQTRFLKHIIDTFRTIDAHSPAIDAYLRWLQRNTEEEEERKSG